MRLTLVACSRAVVNFVDNMEKASEVFCESDRPRSSHVIQQIPTIEPCGIGARPAFHYYEFDWLEFVAARVPSSKTKHDLITTYHLP
jgi:hypothetical protein